MKRIILASTLALATAGAAFGATEAEMQRIQQYLPDVDISAWSDAEVNEALTIIQGNQSRSEITGQLNALASGQTYTASSAQLSEAEMVTLQDYAEGVDLSMLPQATVDAALNVASSEMSQSDKESRIMQLLSSDTTAMSETNTASASEVALINQYAPNIDVSMLSEAQVNTALSIIYSNDDRSDITSKLESLLN